MWPLLWSGLEVSIEERSLAELEPGDLAVVLSPEGPVVHRVVEREGALCTQGDWREVADGPIRPEALLGVVRGFPLGRWVLPLPPACARWLNRRMLTVAPVLRRTLQRPEVIHAARSVRDRIARSALGRAMTGTEPVSVKVLGTDHEQALRRNAWRRGKYASEWHRQLRELVRERSGFALGALHPRRGLVGQCLFVEQRGGAALTALDHWVDPWFRGRGIGRELLLGGIEEARRRGHARVRATVRAGTPARRLWAALGASFEPRSDDASLVDASLATFPRAGAPVTDAAAP